MDQVEIDLTKNQLLKTPVKCWVRDEDGGNWLEKWLVVIWNNKFFCIPIEKYNPDSILVNPKAVITLHGWNICTLQDPHAKKTKKWKTIHDIPAELWGKALVKEKNDPVNKAWIMTPNDISDTFGCLVWDLHYLPLGQALTSEWLDFESEVVE